MSTTYTDDWPELFGMTLDDWLCTGTVHDIPPALSWDRVRLRVVDEVNARLAGRWDAVLDPTGTITSSSRELFEPGVMKKIAGEVRGVTIDSADWMARPDLRHDAGR
ncbi:hypothetical protein [Nocardia sp. AG03]|uniref:hypothetical protein n=1 Tax=Nocardia sp. AG03 TaxID=3025312 RepID=UPI0024187BD1|nr:hypothetical protein [Nocardia sp. AG03]